MTKTIMPLIKKCLMLKPSNTIHLDAHKKSLMLKPNTNVPHALKKLSQKHYKTNK
jgi:hypothetical protein